MNGGVQIVAGESPHNGLHSMRRADIADGTLTRLPPDIVQRYWPLSDATMTKQRYKPTRRIACSTPGR